SAPLSEEAFSAASRGPSAAKPRTAAVAITPIVIRPITRPPDEFGLLFSAVSNYTATASVFLCSANGSQQKTGTRTLTECAVYKRVHQALMTPMGIKALRASNRELMHSSSQSSIQVCDKQRSETNSSSEKCTATILKPGPPVTAVSRTYC